MRRQRHWGIVDAYSCGGEDCRLPWYYNGWIRKVSNTCEIIGNLEDTGHAIWDYA